jgi:hypothetical protein
MPQKHGSKVPGGGATRKKKKMGCIMLLSDLNLSRRLLSGTPLYRMSHLNSKESKENLQPFAIEEFLLAPARMDMMIYIVRLNFPTL